MNGATGGRARARVCAVAFVQSMPVVDARRGAGSQRYINVLTRIRKHFAKQISTRFIRHRSIQGVKLRLQQSTFGYLQIFGQVWKNSFGRNVTSFLQIYVLLFEPRLCEIN